MTLKMFIMQKYTGFLITGALALVVAWSPATRAAEPASKPATAPSTQPADVLTLDLGGGVSMKFIKISAGKFTMGVPADSPDRVKSDQDEHEVAIAKEFWMGVTEVTQAQYEAVMGANPTDPNKEPMFSKSVSRDPQQPVVYVNWNQVTEFCKKLSARTAKTIRPPTEEEWEYACRAGGDGLGGDKLADVAWCKENSEGKPHPVGGKAPNAWGLYDMLGNVGEWAKGAKGVYIRGGSWGFPGARCRPNSREPHGGLHNDPRSGFRVVVEAQ